MATAYLSPQELETRKAQMFPALSDAQVRRIGSWGTERSYSAGEVLFSQGESGVPMFVILEGEMEIVHPDGDSRLELITTHTRHHFTGELSMLVDRRALVCGRAKTALRAIRIEHDKLKTLLQTDSELSDIFMRAFILRRIGLLSGGQGDAIVIGSRHSAATLRVQAFLTRNGHPHRYVDVDRDADVQKLLDQFQVTVKDIPVLICRGQKVLRNPSDAEVADCLGFNPTLSADTVHDLVIVGAGPGGLAAAVYATSEGLEVLLIEARSPGGQAASSSKIENYLGFPTGISGGALTARALNQAEKFGARLAVARGATALHCDETPMRVELTDGSSVRARAIVVATGVDYRKLEVDGLARYEGVGVYYAATWVEAQRCSEDEIIVVGGGNSAGQAATFLARNSKHVHILVRGPDLASSMSRYLISRIEETPNITLHRHTRIVAVDGGDHLEGVTWRDEGTGQESRHPIRHVFTMAGAIPNSEWLRGCVAMDAHGFVLTGPDLPHDGSFPWTLARRPYLFETSKPRVFAVGDIRANSVKRVASAVGEGSVCIQLVHKALTE
jgi:thioredoxin reductase (NADPH)